MVFELCYVLCCCLFGLSNDSIITILSSVFPRGFSSAVVARVVGGRGVHWPRLLNEFRGNKQTMLALLIIRASSDLPLSLCSTSLNDWWGKLLDELLLTVLPSINTTQANVDGLGRHCD